MTILTLQLGNCKFVNKICTFFFLQMYNVLCTLVTLNVFIIKADMKSYKSLETAAIFYSSKPFLKQGIS